MSHMSQIPTQLKANIMERKQKRKYYSEKWLEVELHKRVRMRGGTTRKFRSPGKRGGPDRLVLLPTTMKNSTSFVEVKSTGKTPEPIQLEYHKDLRKLGFKTFIIDDLDSLNAFLAWLFDDLKIITG